MIAVPLTRARHLRLKTIAKAKGMSVEDWATGALGVVIDAKFAELKPKQKKFIRAQILSAVDRKGRTTATTSIDDGRIEKASQETAQQIAEDMAKAKPNTSRLDS